MNFPRRQHNATILPDGMVLVTGGTRGGGPAGSDGAFSNLSPGQPVHIAELWDSQTGQWTMLAAEQTDRCYHVPDGTSRTSGPLFLAARKPVPARPPRSVRSLPSRRCPRSGPGPASPGLDDYSPRAHMAAILI